MPYIIYADIESFIKKIDGRANNPEKSWTTTKIGYHIPYGYSMPTISSYRKQAYFISWGTLYEKIFWIFKRTHKNIIDFEKKRKCYR